MTEMALGLRDKMRLYGISSRAGPERQVASVAEHYRLVEIARAGEVEEAKVLLKQHIRTWGRSSRTRSTRTPARRSRSGPDNFPRLNLKRNSEASLTGAFPPLAVDEISSFHIGGRVVRLDGRLLRERVSTRGGPVHHVDPIGEIVAGQMYVQFVRLAGPKAPAPLLMWHGGGMTGATWETTPDGWPGWQMFFLRAGFDTYVSDAVERGRASFAPFPQCALFPHGERGLGGRLPLWSGRVLACGPRAAAPYPGVRFPVGAFEA